MPVHDRGQVLADTAVLIADGGRVLSDLAMLRDQAQLFGPVASDPTLCGRPHRGARGGHHPASRPVPPGPADHRGRCRCLTA
ncbi:MAG: hypothetical protein ACRDTJ_20640 [Pseudonocardiaceae bacterium]